jgi:hypothetical protein
MFCFYCRKINTVDPGCKFSSKSEDSFITKGFSNWKNSKERFKEHEKSYCHRHAVAACEALSRQTVVAMMNIGFEKDQEIRRQMLLKQLCCLRYLMRQGLPVRGHCNEGNLYQLMKIRANDIPPLQQWLGNNKYQSPEIVNEQIELMGKEVLRSLLKDINAQPFYALIADETRDASGKEQLAISIRWVDESYQISEDLIGMVNVEQTDAKTLKTVIIDCLIRCNIPLSGCCGQAYDGAANMAGHINGVAKQIQLEEPKAIFVHCFAHSVNLCLQECGRRSRPIRDALSLVNEIHNFITLSPKRLAMFENLQTQSSPNLPSIKPLCPTRWTVRATAVDSVLKNYPILLEELEKISEESSGDIASKASGLATSLEQFSTFFGLKLSYLVFSATEQLSTTLQGKDITAQIGINARDSTVNFLQRQRNQSSFDLFYDATNHESQQITEEPKVPRKKKIPRRIDQGSETTNHQTPRDYFRQQYYEVIDILIIQLKQRLDQKGLMILSDIEQLLIDSCNGDANSPSSTIIGMYQSVIDISRLSLQLKMLPDLLHASNQGKKVSVKKVTSINTICDIMNNAAIGKSMFSEVHKLLCIYLTVPMTSATAERTFSALRRLKNYLRVTMTQKRLNNVMILHVHKDRTDEVNLTEIAKQFVHNERRLLYFGHFS